MTELAISGRNMLGPSGLFRLRWGRPTSDNFAVARIERGEGEDFLLERRSLRPPGQKRHLSQGQLAKEAGVNRDTVVRAEAGKPISVESEQRIAAALDRLSAAFTAIEQAALQRQEGLSEPAPNPTWEEQLEEVRLRRPDIFQFYFPDVEPLEDVPDRRELPHPSPLNYPDHPLSTNREIVPKGGGEDDPATTRVRELEARIERIEQQHAAEVQELRDMLKRVTRVAIKRDESRKAPSDKARRRKPDSGTD